MKLKFKVKLLALLIVASLIPAACAAKVTEDAGALPINVDTGVVNNDEFFFNFSYENIPLSVFAITSFVPEPEASGILVESNEKAMIDYSNMSQGYVMIKYLTAMDCDLKVQMITPGGKVLSFNLRKDGGYDVYPLTDGNGTYALNVCYEVPGRGYTLAFNSTINVTLEDEFGPFLRPSTYMNYTETSPWILKANELIGGNTDMLTVVTTIYNFVVENVTYDYTYADRVRASDPSLDPYAPVDIASVYANGTGVCSGYAALMTSMLRSQGIPTRYVVGTNTRGEDHAWINTYSDETGWVDGVVFFDGKGWKLMDPTYASTGGETGVKYAENAANYYVYYYY